MQVFVRDNGVDHAVRQLKRKLRSEGLFRALKRRQGLHSSARPGKESRWHGGGARR
jgi:ribosomal protein S21